MVSASHSTVVPAGALAVQRERLLSRTCHRFEVSHEAGKVLEVVPEPVHLVPGPVDGQGLGDVNSTGGAAVLLDHAGSVGALLTAVTTLAAKLLAGEEVDDGDTGNGRGGCGNPVPVILIVAHGLAQEGQIHQVSPHPGPNPA